MTIPAFWGESWTAALANHLWQSTVVVAIAWLLALLLRNNHARTRYWVWLAASLKFLLPFSLLITAGEWLRSLLAQPMVDRPAVTAALQQIAQPFAQAQVFETGKSPVATHRAGWLPVALLALWACGGLLIAARFASGWWRASAAKHAARPLETANAVPVLLSPTLREPRIFGIFRPVLLLPEGILEWLTAEQMRAIMAHEMCHVRRKDNLTFALHMVVETLFWFHPAVWWIGARLIEERERACDEAVVEACGAAEVYAEGILNVCKFYVESSTACVAGVTGADLKRRIARIMAGKAAMGLTLSKKFLRATAASLLLTMPILFVILTGTGSRAQLLHPDNGPAPTFEVATVKPGSNGSAGVNFGILPDRFSATNATAKELIEFAYNVKTDGGIEGGPKWMDSEKFDVDAKISDAEMAAMQKLPPSRRFDQYRLMMQSLLAERFGLITSTRTRELPVYALVVAKNGPKLTQVKPGEQHMPQLWGGSRGDMRATSVSMPLFADWISGGEDTDGRAVIDRTGLTGSYNFTLKWTRIAHGANAIDGTATNQPATSAIAIEQGGSSFFTALQEQLGLKLESTKGPVQVLVIDHIDEQPTAN